jgi:hypothetical protein
MIMFMNYRAHYLRIDHGDPVSASTSGNLNSTSVSGFVPIRFFDERIHLNSTTLDLGGITAGRVEPRRNEITKGYYVSEMPGVLPGAFEPFFIDSWHPQPRRIRIRFVPRAVEAKRSHRYRFSLDLLKKIRENPPDLRNPCSKYSSWNAVSCMAAGLEIFTRSGKIINVRCHSFLFRLGV